MESPTLNFASAAVPASMTTCFGPWANWPVLSLSGLNCGWDASLPSPNLGASPEPSALPSRPRILASLDSIGASVPPAEATSGSARTFASRGSGTVAAPLVEPLTISLPAMTASVWS